MARRDPYLPWPGNPRRFYAIAMPNGDNRVDVRVNGELVFLKELRVGVKEPGCILTRAEAEALHHELGQALRAFDLARAMAVEVAIEVGAVAASSSAAVGEQERPRPYVGPYPIRGATLAEVDALACGEAA